MPGTLGVCFKSVSLLEILVFKNKRKNYCLVAYIYNNYSLAPGVSFDLLQRLYKLEHHTVLCCSGPDICTAGLSVMITPGPQAINQLKHPIVRDLAGIHALRPWALRALGPRACIPARSLTGVF